MNIVHFSWEFPPVIFGGLGTFASEITKKQIDLGHDVTVFALNRENQLTVQNKIQNIKTYRPKTLDLTSTFHLFADYELRSWGNHFKFFADVISYNIASATILVNDLVQKKGKKFDIIDAHDWLGIPGGIIAKKELQLPLIFHVHSTEIGRSLGRGSHTIKDIEFEGGQEADRVITVSHAMSDELQKFGFPEHKIRVCWNGVDPEKYNPNKVSNNERKTLRSQYNIADTDHMLFFIGRLVTVKGVENLIHAMPQIINEYPDIKLVILGIGDLEQYIKTFIKQHNLQENIILRTEFVSEPERIIHYAAADSVVLPSLYEPFGIVCTEAMAMEKPVIVGARGTNGMREQIIPSGEQQCGYHINPFNPEDIAWGIKQILNSPEKNYQLGKNARQRVYEEFSWEKVTQRTLDIYSELVPQQTQKQLNAI